MENTNVLPIIIVFEHESETPFSKLIYQAEKFKNKSILHFSNCNSNNKQQSFKSQLGERTYRNLNIITWTNADLLRIGDMDNEKIKPDNNIINFVSGNPANEITNGIIHFYKYDKHSHFKISTRMLCMISVPRSMGIKDILDFTASYRDYIEEMKVVKDATPNEYIILLKFRSTEDTDNFYKNFNNVNFNSLEPSICHLAYVSHVESLASSSTATFPLLELTELPTCPVCLERLDEPLDGILTIVCNHTFHSKCVQQMNESTCPVCRYPQTPQVMSDKYKCGMCDLREDLWLCLICAHIGCGRHENKHAEHHFNETGHTFAMKIGNNLVWDYAADAHVHRLVANNCDGKPVEVDSEDPDDKKMSNICMEYTALLADQLSAQRTYLESEFCVHLSMVEHQLERQSQVAKETDNQYRSVLKEKQMLEKRCNQVMTNFQKLEKEHKEESILNKALLEKQNHLMKSLKSKDEELINLQEQLTDLMMNLQMGSKIAEAQSRGELNEDEINHASISLGATTTTHSKTRRPKRK